MLRFYPIVIIIQAYCVYHAYKNRADQKWYWLIILFPILGSAFYLYHHFYSRKNVEAVSEGLKGVFNSNYEVEKLEKKMRFSDSTTNKINLADKYLETGRYQDAIELYESCLEGFDEKNNDIFKSLLHANYKLKDYGKAIYYGDQIENSKTFSKSEEKISYAWSLYHLGEMDRAEQAFREMDLRFVNYRQRAEFSRFLNELGRKEEAISNLEELLGEFEHMQRDERRQKRFVQRSIVQLHAELTNPKTSG